MINREQFVSECLSTWIDSGLTNNEMAKVAELIADCLESYDSPEALEADLVKLAAPGAPAPEAASSGMVDALLNKVPYGAAISGLLNLGGSTLNKGIDIATNTLGSAAKYAPIVAVGGLTVPYFAGRYLGRMGAENMDESGYAVKTLKDREILQALRDATDRVKYQQEQEENI